MRLRLPPSRMDVNKPLTARLTSTYDQCFDDCKAAIALEEKVTASGLSQHVSATS